MKLFCLTYAGGTAAFYDGLESQISPKIQVIKVEYAGHGKRYREGFYNTFSELSGDIIPFLKKQLKEREPYAMMGYSMGSVSVVVILDRIIKEHILHLPTHIFLAAHEPDTKRELQGFKPSELDQYVKERTVQFGGIPEKLLRNRAFWRVYLPIYRADYSMLSRFDFNSLDLYSEIPATIFYSETDTPKIRLAKWRNYFKNIEYMEYQGSHFFISECYEDMAEKINMRLLK